MFFDPPPDFLKQLLHFTGFEPVGLKGTSHFFPQASQVTLCISFRSPDCPKLLWLRCCLFRNPGMPLREVSLFIKLCVHPDSAAQRGSIVLKLIN